MSEPVVSLSVNGVAVTVPEGAPVSTAIAKTGVAAFRRSITGQPRAPLCGMGICFECRVTIDGLPHRLSCQTPCAPGMEVSTLDPTGSADVRPAASRLVSTHSSNHYDIVVAGAGPAGLAAARRGAESGSSVILVDDNPRPGGQIWRSDSRRPREWLNARKVDLITGARIFAANPETVALETATQKIELTFGKLILATGARERFLPFPGWTLPNVMGAGGLQALVKGGLAIEGKRVIVAGSGPLLLAVASYLRGHGASVSLIAEQAESSALIRFAAALAAHPPKLAQALRLRAALLGAPYRTGCWPIAAEGSEKLESVTLRRAGKSWKEPCDYLACGFGLIPNTELANLLGCVDLDEYQQTNVPGIYCAGEAAGIGGLELSLVEGEIAGYAAAGKLAMARSRFRARESQRRFAALLNQTFALRPELKSLSGAGTLVCRCEDVPFERLARCSGWREAKLHTRCGMGPCQGRVCGGAVEFLFGWKPESVRPPVFPVRLGSL